MITVSSELCIWPHLTSRWGRGDDIIQSSNEGTCRGVKTPLGSHTLFIIIFIYRPPVNCFGAAKYRQIILNFSLAMQENEGDSRGHLMMRFVWLTLLIFRGNSLTVAAATFFPAFPPSLLAVIKRTVKTESLGERRRSESAEVLLPAEIGNTTQIC